MGVIIPPTSLSVCVANTKNFSFLVPKPINWNDRWTEKKENYIDLDDMLHITELTYNENIDFFHFKIVGAKTSDYTLPLGVNVYSDLKLILKPLLTKEVKVIFTIDDARLRSSSTTNKPLNVTKKSSFTQNRVLSNHIQVL